ncbi:MAG: DUF6602 domain-containing protein [Anaerolineales bacterium]|jgi:hypothetical protein
MADLARLLEAYYEILATEFGRLCTSGQIPHHGERGRLLEEALSSFLSQVLPARVAIGSGQIAGSTTPETSSQTDVVLYDSVKFPLLINQESSQLFLTESVLAAIEVKSTLNKGKAEEGFEVTASAKRLPKFPPGTFPPTPGILFAYRTEWTKAPRPLAEMLYKQVPLSLETAPVMVCSLYPGFIIAATNALGYSVTNLGAILAGREEANRFPPNMYVLIRPLGAIEKHVLLFFYLLIATYLKSTLQVDD